MQLSQETLTAGALSMANAGPNTNGSQVGAQQSLLRCMVPDPTLAFPFEDSPGLLIRSYSCSVELSEGQAWHHGYRFPQVWAHFQRRL